MKELRAVILGFAHMHVNEISEYIRGQAGIRLVGCADLPPDLPEATDKRYTRAWNLRNVCAAHGLTPHEGWEDLLDAAAPDIAFILCENAAKPLAVEACARRGIHVCVEKPMAVSLDAALAIRESARSHGILAMVNWPTTWRPYVQQLAAALESGEMGRLLKLSYINGHTGPLGVGARHRGVEAAAETMTDDERARTWWYRKAAGGGAILDIGCYGCMYSAWLQKEKPLYVAGFAANLNTPYADTADNLAAIIAYPSSFSVIEGTWTLPQRVLPTGPLLCCEGGVLYCTPDRRVAAVSLSGEELPVPGESAPCLANIAEQYVRYQSEGVPLHPTVTLDQNVKMMALLDAVAACADSGKREPVRDIP